MKPIGPPPAVHLRDLPCDERGYLIPAETPWDADGVPQLSRLEPNLVVILTAYRACAVCGFALRRDELVWRIVDEYSRGTVFADMRERCSTFFDPPGHLICMLYSALVCPYWKTPGSRLSKDSQYQPGGKRGEVASILGYADYALLIDPSPSRSGQQERALLYQGFTEEVSFRSPEDDLAERYQSLRQACGGRYVQKRRRHYGPIYGGEPRLYKEALAAHQALNEHGLDGDMQYEGRLFARIQSGWA